MNITDIGPEAFSTDECGGVVSWRGVNYYADAGTLRSVYRLWSARVHNAYVAFRNRGPQHDH